MNKINSKKLPSSQWTAVKPVLVSGAKEKHYLITEVEFGEEGDVIFCEIEAVISHRKISIQWQQLTDDSCWLFG